LGRSDDGNQRWKRLENSKTTGEDCMSNPSSLKGKNVLITAGPNREYIDPVRFISNPSSGKMGMAIAEEALARGANVTVVYGAGTAKPPASAKVIDVETTAEMAGAVVRELKEKRYAVMIAAAASTDYEPEKKAIEKIPSKQPSLLIHLKPTVRIIEEARKTDRGIYICAFKAETNISKDELIERAYRRVKQVGLDLIVANDVGQPGRGFTTDTNEVYIIDKNRNITHVPLASKNEIAVSILEAIEKNLGSRD
jgi:phosphopantothenoylcysteine decarboxylase / phosphopantothenate---cysteine ligase